MIVTLRDLNYNFNKIEMIIKLTNKEFDGEIHKAILNIKLKFGVKCSAKKQGLTQGLNQEINQEILWTENDANTLFEQINNIFQNESEQRTFSRLGVIEPEFEALCFHQAKQNQIELFVSIGISGYGSTIRLNTTKHELLKWIKTIKSYF